METREWTLVGPAALRLTLHDVARWLEMDAKTLRGMIEAGRFPRGYKPTPQSEPFWTGCELAAWLLLRDRWHPEPEGEPGETRESQGKRGKPGGKLDDANPLP